MIHVEKISSSLHNTHQTFIDVFTCTELERLQHFNPGTPHGIAKDFICADLIGKDVTANLANITLGKYFGTAGINIDLLLSGSVNIENLVVEISIDTVNTLPKIKLKHLIENHIVILNDFEEGGNFYGNISLENFLIQRNITPKLLFFTGGCFQQRDLPELNVYKIVFDFWLLATVFSDEFFYSAIFDQTKKQKLLDQLELVPERFCVFPSLKPRQHRIILLVMLYKLGLLKYCDWSLGLELSKITNHVYDDFNLNSYLEHEHATSFDVLNFINNHTFPKLLDGSCVNFKDLVSPSIELINKYKYYISSETYSGAGSNTGVFVTEKTYKSFLIGSMPILHTDPSARNYVNNMGFKCTYASSDPRDICGILELLLNEPYSTADRLHNFDLITNKDFLVNSVVQPLNKIASLINSIRR